MGNPTDHHGTMFFILALSIVATILTLPASAQLSLTFYDTTCPSVFTTVRAAVRSAIAREARIGASIMRLYFHDCFVNGCDGGLLLDDTGTFVGEKTAFPNVNSARGFEVIDSIKAQVDKACGGVVVSCADILAIAARDSVAEYGGPAYSIPVGRRDARTASKALANSNLPGPAENLDSITAKFNNQGFTNLREVVVLSGAHTVGFAQCKNFRAHIYNDTNIDPSFAATRQSTCPAAAGTGDANLAPLDDQSPNRFGNNYFQGLMNKRGLLHSDQVLFNGGAADSIVTAYANDPNGFSTDFANAMIKMGNLNPLTGAQGEVRVNCRKVN